MRTAVRLTMLFVVALSVVGCATTSQLVPAANKAVDISTTDMARIYVVRPAFVGTAIKFGITENGKQMGTLAYDSYLCWDRESGHVVLRAKSENRSEIEFDAEAGKTYYIHAHVRMGMIMARVKLELLDNAEGKRALGKCGRGAK